MKISRDLLLTFWIVTYPTKDSELYDIAFESNFISLMIQTVGGLSPRQVYGIFSTREEAFEHARYLMKIRTVGKDNCEITKKLFPSLRTKKY